MPHGVVVVGNLPLRRTGERLGDLVFGHAQGARLIAVEYDFEFGNPRGKVLRDQPVRVAQPGDAGLNHQVNRGTVFEEARTHQIQPGAHVNDHVVELLPRHRNQLVDGLVGGIKLGKLARRRQHRDAGTMLDQQLGEKTRIQPPEILKRVDGRVFGFHSQVQRGVSQRKIQINQQCALPRLLGQRYGKIAGQRGHAVSALGAQKDQQPPPRLLRGARGRAAG